MRLESPTIFCLLALLLFSPSGCATNAQQVISRDREYQRMLDLQRQKADVIGQDMELTKLPEMGAEDHDRLGDRQQRKGNGFLALLEYQKALKIDPNRVVTRFKMGQLLMTRGLEEEALKEFEMVERQEPAGALGALGKGILYFKKGELKQAHESLNRALTSNPNLFQAHGILGLIFEQQKQFDAAITHHQKALTLNPGSAALHNNLGMSYYLKGELLSSVDAFLTAVQMDPNNSRIYNNLGLALARMGRYDEALQAFKKGKDEPSAYNNIGYIYLTEGKYLKAATALEKAIEIKPQFYVKAHENKERVMFELKDAAK